MSYPLPLAPLPHIVSNPPCGAGLPFVQGFVDEAVIDRMLAHTAAAERLHAVRTTPVHEDLVLSSGDEDYAGWHGGIRPRLAAQPSFSLPLSLVADTPACQPRRATPPEIAEPGIEPSYHSGHRWWLAAAAGAVSSLLFATVLVSIAMNNRQPQSDYVLRTTVPATPPLATEPSPAPAAPLEITSRALP
jgi:hypothetical protein